MLFLKTGAHFFIRTMKIYICLKYLLIFWPNSSNIDNLSKFNKKMFKSFKKKYLRPKNIQKFTCLQTADSFIFLTKMIYKKNCKIIKISKKKTHPFLPSCGYESIITSILFYFLFIQGVRAFFYKQNLDGAHQRYWRVFLYLLSYFFYYFFF